MEIVSELPLFRFMVTCPDGFHLTVLKARWDRQERLRELVADIGTVLPQRREVAKGIEYQARLLEAKTGRRWSLQETAAFMKQQHGLAGIRRQTRGDE